MSIASGNKSQTSDHNGRNHIRLHPLFHPEVYDLFADTILKPHPLMLQQNNQKEHSFLYCEPVTTGNKVNSSGETAL